MTVPMHSVGLRHDESRWTAPARVDLVIVLLAAISGSLLVLPPWPLNLLLLTAPVTFVITLVSPPIALGLCVASIPIQAMGEHHLGPLTLRYTSTMILALFIAWSIGKLAGRRGVRGSWLIPPFACYVVILFLSGIQADSVRDWLSELYRWSVALLALVVAVDTLRDARSARPVIFGVAVGMVGASLFGIYQVVTGLGPRAFNVGGLIRAYSTFGQPNPFAGYLELSLPLLLAVAGSWLGHDDLHPRRGGITRGLGLVSVVALPFGLVALVLTQSRGGWVGASVGLVVVVWLTGGWLRWAATVVVAMLVMVVLVTPVGSRVTDRIAGGEISFRDDVQVTTTNFAARERLAHWRAGIAMTRSHPILGVGAGNFSRNFRDDTPTWRFRVSRGHAHNAYIQAAAQTGFLGLTSYLALLAVVVGRLSLALRLARDSEHRALVVGAIGVTAAFCIHNLFDYLHVLSFGIQLSVVWAFAEVMDVGSEISGHKATVAP
jgi:O-antigen ligase